MGGLQKFVVVIGRILLSFIFLLAAVNKIIDWHGSEEALIQAMNHFILANQGVAWLHETVNVFLPWASVLLAIALVFELVGGLFIFFGVKVRFGAILLLLFLIPTTFFFHSFWTFQDPDRHLQMTIFLKNISIFGGLLLVLAYGACSPRQHRHEHIEMEAPE